jgi:hypothetical protein
MAAFVIQRYVVWRFSLYWSRRYFTFCILIFIILVVRYLYFFAVVDNYLIIEGNSFKLVKYKFGMEPYSVKVADRHYSKPQGTLGLPIFLFQARISWRWILSPLGYLRVFCFHAWSTNINVSDFVYLYWFRICKLITNIAENTFPFLCSIYIFSENSTRTY